MIKYCLIIFFIIFSAAAEVVVTEGSYTYTGEISKNDACQLAKERAKLKALERYWVKQFHLMKWKIVLKLMGKQAAKEINFS